MSDLSSFLIQVSKGDVSISESECIIISLSSKKARLITQRVSDVSTIWFQREQTALATLAKGLGSRPWVRMSIVLRHAWKFSRSRESLPRSRIYEMISGAKL